ncbi:MAG TPA: MarR family transcriptional regulator [Mycobacteriales bacterium]|nr:MarR family transcriptional regulator [Mycobacteriales bacterium]HWA66435.1 MarR family transcriptional regulator [Mycobacteriales bacterium]
MSREPLDLPFDPIARAGAIWETKFGPAAAMRVATSVMRAQQLLLSRFDEILKPHDLTFARYEALVLLHFSRAGELPLSVIGQRLMVHPTSVTNIVDRLVAQGFVERRPNPRDGRGVLARLTAPGRRTVKRATTDLMADGFGLAMYDEADLGTLFDQLRRLRVAAGDFQNPA